MINTERDDAVIPVEAESAPSRIATPSVVDHYADILRALPRRKRAGLIGQISRGFYDGWRPSRREVADLVAVELNLLSIDAFEQRQRQRRLGREPLEDFIPAVVSRGRPTGPSAQEILRSPPNPG